MPVPENTKSVPLQPFHLAIQVTDLQAARAFYGGLLQCPEGRSAERWVDFDLYGHQLVAHLVTAPASSHRASSAGAPTNPVDGQDVPVPHFGVVLSMAQWRDLATRLQAHSVEFVIEPQVRFAGLPGEQATMFLLDPCGNALEFKAFSDPRMLFATEEPDQDRRI